MADDFINALGGSASATQTGGGTAAGTTADILRNQVMSQLVATISGLTAEFQRLRPAGAAPPTTP
jgi:hypothetical protein